MNEYDVKRLALVNSELAKLEAMKVRNEQNLREGNPPSYGENEFMEVSCELRSLAYKENEEL